MKNHIRNTRIMISGIFVMVVGLAAIPAHAQVEGSASFDDLIKQQGSLTEVLTGEAVPAELAGRTFDQPLDLPHLPGPQPAPPATGAKSPNGTKVLWQNGTKMVSSFPRSVAT